MGTERRDRKGEKCWGIEKFGLGYVSWGRNRMVWGGIGDLGRLWGGWGRAWGVGEELGKRWELGEVRISWGLMRIRYYE